MLGAKCSTWSAMGSAPTQLEQHVLAACPHEALSGTAQRLLELGRLIGAGPLVAVLDALSGEAVKLPTRRAFFEACYRPLRDDAIRRALAQGFTVEHVAREFRMSKRRVEQVRNEAPTATERGACGRRTPA